MRVGEGEGATSGPREARGETGSVCGALRPGTSLGGLGERRRGGGGRAWLESRWLRGRAGFRVAQARVDAQGSEESGRVREAGLGNTAGVGRRGRCPGVSLDLWKS